MSWYEPLGGHPVTWENEEGIMMARIEFDPPKILREENITPNKIWRNGPWTIVEWRDGTKTKVKAEESDALNPYSGFCAALAKKVFGTTGKAVKAMDNAVYAAGEKARERKRKAVAAKVLKQQCKQIEKANEETMIKARMKEIRINNIAYERIMEEDNQKTSKSAED